MVSVDIKGLKELERYLKNLPQEIRKKTEKALREEAYRIVLTAQTKCPDPEIREQIRTEVTSHGDNIEVSIYAPERARKYLEQAFNEHKNEVSPIIADAVDRALRKK